MSNNDQWNLPEPLEKAVRAITPAVTFPQLESTPGHHAGLIDRVHDLHALMAKDPGLVKLAQERGHHPHELHRFSDQELEQPYRNAFRAIAAGDVSHGGPEMHVGDYRAKHALLLGDDTPGIKASRGVDRAVGKIPLKERSDLEWQQRLAQATQKDPRLQQRDALKQRPWWKIDRKEAKSIADWQDQTKRLGSQAREQLKSPTAGRYTGLTFGGTAMKGSGYHIDDNAALHHEHQHLIFQDLRDKFGDEGLNAIMTEMLRAMPADAVYELDEFAGKRNYKQNSPFYQEEQFNGLLDLLNAHHTSKSPYGKPDPWAQKYLNNNPHITREALENAISAAQAVAQNLTPGRVRELVEKRKADKQKYRATSSRQG